MLIAVLARGNEVLARVRAAIHERLAVLNRCRQRGAFRAEQPLAVEAAKALRLRKLMPDAFAATAEAHRRNIPREG